MCVCVCVCVKRGLTGQGNTSTYCLVSCHGVDNSQLNHGYALATSASHGNFLFQCCCLCSTGVMTLRILPSYCKVKQKDFPYNLFMSHSGRQSYNNNKLFVTMFVDADHQAPALVVIVIAAVLPAVGAALQAAPTRAAARLVEVRCARHRHRRRHHHHQEAVPHRLVPAPNERNGADGRNAHHPLVEMPTFAAGKQFSS